MLAIAPVTTSFVDKALDLEVENVHMAVGEIAYVADKECTKFATSK